MSLAEKRCIPCHGDTSALTRESAEQYLEQVKDWSLSDNASRVYREFMFPDFKTALGFAAHVGELAEEAGHHPEICFGWGHARVEIWTHKIGGLHENDFILAARIDNLKET